MKYHQLVKAIDSASQQLLGRAAAVVNQSLVIRNWVVGAYIVEFEQNGEDRARYGERLVASLANDLHKRGLQGFSLSNLKSYRQFYKTYPQIGQTLSGFSGLRQIPEISQTLSAQLKISSSLVRKSPSVITPLSPKAEKGSNPSLDTFLPGPVCDLGSGSWKLGDERWSRHRIRRFSAVALLWRDKSSGHIIQNLHPPSPAKRDSTRRAGEL